MTYKVAWGQTCEELTKAVNIDIKEGYEPCAGLWGGPRGFYQPMLKRTAAEQPNPKKAA